MALENVAETDVVGALTLVEVEVDTLADTVTSAYTSLDWCRHTFGYRCSSTRTGTGRSWVNRIISALTLFEVEVDVLLLTNVGTPVDLLEHKDGDCDADVGVLGVKKF